MSICQKKKIKLKRGENVLCCIIIIVYTFDDFFLSLPIIKGLYFLLFLLYIHFLYLSFLQQLKISSYIINQAVI